MAKGEAHTISGREPSAGAAITSRPVALAAGPEPPGSRPENILREVLAEADWAVSDIVQELRFALPYLERSFREPTA